MKNENENKIDLTAIPTADLSLELSRRRDALSFVLEAGDIKDMLQLPRAEMLDIAARPLPSDLEALRRVFNRWIDGGAYSELRDMMRQAWEEIMEREAKALQGGAVADLAEHFAGDGHVGLVLAIEGDAAKREELLRFAVEYGAKRGTNAAAWAEQYMWGGRVSARESVANARAFLKQFEDGDPALVSSMPQYHEGDTWNATALPFALTWCFSQRFDDARAILKKHGLWEDYLELSEAMEDAARHAFDSACEGELYRSAMAVLPENS